MVDTPTLSQAPKAEDAPAADAGPSVLAVLVVKDGAAWLRRTLASLGRQTHPRFGVLAVDNASTDPSPQILAEVLGPRRVLRLERNAGFPAAVGAALATPGPRQADYVLLLHDDTVLAPDTVETMVEAAERGTEVGIVGAKVLDWERPRMLREVGLATDRFAFPYSPLEDEEIDQGQYDSERESLYVSSAAMLVSREAWTRAGPPDERIGSCHGDLDFCWRVRLAGFRVIVQPGARVLHRAAWERGERGPDPEHGRYLSERAGLLAMLKNYRAATLAWVLPLYVLQGLAKVALFILSRRFSNAGQVLRAWGWNLARLPGTLHRRARGHAVRRARDRDVVQFMAPAGSRLRRWALQASAVLVGHTGPLEPEEAPAPRMRERVTGIIRAYPVALALGTGIVLSAIAFREMLFGSTLGGGALARLPRGASDLFGELAAGWRSHGFGGAGGPSPALAPLGAGSLLTFGNPRLFVRLLLAATPAIAAVSCYRAVLRLVPDRLAAVTAAACYALSAPVLWAVSDGRLGVIALLLALPWTFGRLLEAFERPDAATYRWIAGTAIGVALATAFFPSAWLALAAAVPAVALLPPPGGNRLRGLAVIAAAAGAAALLLAPHVLELARDPAFGASVDAAGAPRASAVLRLAAGPAPGAWAAAAFLPLAATIALGVAEDRRAAWRTAATVAGCIVAAWLAAAGRLPAALSNPVGFLAAAAFWSSALVALGLRPVEVRAGDRGASFGYRQVAVGGLVAVLALGLALQAASALEGRWGVGEDREPPGWPAVAAAEPGGSFRVLWLGRPGGASFPQPGGAPDGVVEAGTASARFGVTPEGGREMASLGLPATGPGFERLRGALGAILSGRVRHGGALLSTLGIRWIAAEPRLPAAVVVRLGQQVDLDLVQREGGLLLYRSAAPRTAGAALAGDAGLAARRSDLLSAARLRPGERIALERRGRGWSGRLGFTAPGAAILPEAFDPGWRAVLEPGGEAAPFRAFGWGVGFDVPAGAASFRAEHGGSSLPRLAFLSLAWGGALWLSGRRRRPG